MDMHCEDLSGPLSDPTFIKEEPESEDEGPFEQSSQTATITGIYMNQSTGMSSFLNRFMGNKETNGTGSERNEGETQRELVDDIENHSSSDTNYSADSDLDFLPKEELKLLKHRPPRKKTKMRKQSKPLKHASRDNTFEREMDEFKDEFKDEPTVTSEIKEENNVDCSDYSDNFHDSYVNVEGGNENNLNNKGIENKVSVRIRRAKRTIQSKILDDDGIVKRKRRKQERRLECDYCSKLCASKEERDSHMIDAHPDYDGLFICVPCDQSFEGRRQLQNHKKMEHKQADYTCADCDSKFVNKLSYKRHMLTHTNNPLYVCSYCGKSNFIAKGDMERHIRSVHTKEKPYVCKYEGCDKRFPSSGCRSKHYVSHTGVRKHECEYCGIKMQRTSDLRQHIRRHTGEKPFQCTICGMAFTRSYRLKMHRLVIHQVNEHGEKVERKKPSSDDRPHQCETCGKRFCDKTNLQRHHATHTNNRAFVCDTCGSAFNFESNLQRHVQTVHLGRFSYNCPTCAVGCRDKDDYERHMAKHTGSRKHACPICNKSFYTKDALTGHIRTVHLAIRSACSVCGSTFKEIRSHQNHLVKVHKLPLDHVSNEIEEAKRFKRVQADIQEKPSIEVSDDHQSKQIYYNCDICKRDLLSIKSLPKHYMKVHKLSQEEAEARASEEEKRKWTAFQQQTVEPHREPEFQPQAELPPPIAVTENSSLAVDDETASKLIPALFQTPDMSASAIAQAYLMTYRSQFGV